MAEAKQQAREQNLDAVETQELVAAAAAQQINTHNWTHTYWGGCEAATAFFVPGILAVMNKRSPAGMDRQGFSV